MVQGIHVRISRNNECLFEKSSGEAPRNLKSLTNDLKEMQKNVNDILTILVESGKGHEAESEEEDDDDEDLEGFNPKKCRLGE